MTVTPLVDLSRLPAPVVVEQLAYETILQEMLTDLRARHPEFTALVESDPAVKIMEVAAYRAMLILQRVNDSCRAVMVAYAAGADLDQIGANLAVQRLVVDPGDPDANPPVPPTLESDSDYRTRIISAPEGYSVAGPRNAYVWHALSADGQVADASAVSPTPGVVVVTVLGRSGNGTPTSPTLAAVNARLNSDDVRPLTDSVTVQGATIVEYAITAQLYLYPGPEAEPVIEAAQARAQEYAERLRRLGRDVRLSAIYAALHVEGVQRVVLTSPSADIVLGAHQASYCTAINVNVVGVDE